MKKTGKPTAPSFAPVSTRIVPRFAGVSTFLRLPQHDDPHDVDVLICGAPFDGGTTYRPGARFGPRGVRNASALTRGFHPEHGFVLFDRLRCADGGDVACVPMKIPETIKLIEGRTQEIVEASATPFFVGGDHTITLGPLRALAKKYGPLGLIHFDAHSDTFGPAWEVELHHGTVFRKAVEEGLLRPRDVLQIGIRGPFTASGDLDFARKAGFTIVSVDDVKLKLLAVEKKLKALAKRRGPFYVSFDLDALDPVYAPGTGTPVPGGLSTFEAFRLIRALGGLDIVGADVVEISPDHDPSGNTTLVAATIVFEILSSIAVSRSKRGRR